MNLFYDAFFRKYKNEETELGGGRRGHPKCRVGQSRQRI